MTMETRCCQKKVNFKDIRHKISVPLAMSTNHRKKSSKLLNKTRKENPGQILGQDRPEKNSAKCYVIRSGEIPSPRRTSIDKNNDCAMKSERGALARGSDPPSGHSVHKTAGDMWRVPARRLIQTNLGAAVYLVENRRQKFSIPLQWQKTGLFSRFGRRA